MLWSDPTQDMRQVPMFVPLRGRTTRLRFYCIFLRGECFSAVASHSHPRPTCLMVRPRLYDAPGASLPLSQPDPHRPIWPSKHQDVMHRPVSLGCGHYFCQECVLVETRRVTDVSSLPSRATAVPKTRDRNIVRCPLCRRKGVTKGAIELTWLDRHIQSRCASASAPLPLRCFAVSFARFRLPIQEVERSISFTIPRVFDH